MHTRGIDTDTSMNNSYLCALKLSPISQNCRSPLESSSPLTALLIPQMLTDILSILLLLVLFEIFITCIFCFLSRLHFPFYNCLNPNPLHLYHSTTVPSGYVERWPTAENDASSLGIYRCTRFSPPFVQLLERELWKG